ncbi:MAG: ATPase, T2SS/T4P/T4SS family [Promethearchaeia archaeon]
MEKTDLIKEFIDFRNSRKDLKNWKEINFYQYLFKKYISLSTSKEITRKEICLKENKIVNSYKIGQFDLFNVFIYNKQEEREYLYESKLNTGSHSKTNYFLEITERIIEKIEIENYFEIIPIEQLINQYKEVAFQEITDQYHNIANEFKERLSLFIAIKKLKLTKIFPLLIDDFIEEIFLDAEDQDIYLNHQSYGRCKTKKKLKRTEFERIKTLLRLYSGRRIDYNNPSIKHVIKNRFFFTRFAIDIIPVHSLNYSMDIRKLDKNILTIQDLIQNHTLNSRISAFLYYCILKKKNILVTGETDTGKTTLINTLDLLAPKHFRKIYIENIPESLDQMKFGKHQLKYRVNSLDEENDNKISKKKLIKTLLHRSPDIIYLGEILTKEEAEAMFHCFASGLRGFQTIHARSIESLINRFLFHFGIDKFCLEDLDLIILMKNKNNKRFITEIAEIEDIELNDKIRIRKIFQYNPASNGWIISDLYNSKIIQSIRKYENLPTYLFKKYISLFCEIFSFLKKKERLTNSTLVDLFHKLSFHSANGAGHRLNKLQDFWHQWKKTY